MRRGQPGAPAALPYGTMHPMDFAVARHARPSGTVLCLAGELDIATTSTLRSAVDEALAATPARLVLDLSATVFLDSTGAGELMKTAKRAAAAGVPVALVVPPSNWRVRRVVDFMQFGELLPVHDDGAPFA